MIGGGPNGIGTAAYPAKSGEDLIVLEERPECGGAAENTEVIPGVLIDPHTTYFYAGATPSLKQQEKKYKNDFPSQEWTGSYVKVINDSKEYKEAAKLKDAVGAGRRKPSTGLVTWLVPSPVSLK